MRLPNEVRILVDEHHMTPNGAIDAASLRAHALGQEYVLPW